MKKYRLKGANRENFSPSIDYEVHLNPQQLAAVKAGEGPVLVIAGAGSGKTRTITYRVAWLLDSGVNPERILLATFTNKAAYDMLHRVEHLLSARVRKIWGGTFHHIGNLILRRYAHYLGYENNYTIIDREDSKELMSSCLTDLSIDVKKRRFPKPELLCSMISLSVNTRKSIKDVVKRRYSFFLEQLDDIERVLKRFQVKKQRLNIMDFDDLLRNWKKLLVEQPRVRDLYSENFRYVLVDEYQDTNMLQGEIMDLLASFHRNIMVVGDDSQSIYSFRGANFANIIDFPKRYPDAKIFKLETNYRSTPPILHLTNCIIASNEKQFPKLLRPARKGEFKPVVVPTRDANQQAEFVAERILELLDEGKSLRDMAVLYRSHYHCLELQMELTRRGIPFEVRSGLRFFERAHIKDVTAYLKILVNPRDELSWKRVLKIISGIGNVTADKIWKKISRDPEPVEKIKSKEIRNLFPRKVPAEWSGFVELLTTLKDPSLQKNPGGMIHLLLEEGYRGYLRSKYPDYDEREEDLGQLASFARDYSSLRSFLSELALLGTVESETVLSGAEENEDEFVVLSTVHQAKGLEWPVVFVIWLSDGRFPAAKALKRDQNLEEERRLLYVATTRAKEELFLCFPLIGGNWRRAVLMKPSRFLKEIERLDDQAFEQWIVDEEVEVLLERMEKRDYMLE